MDSYSRRNYSFLRMPENAHEIDISRQSALFDGPIVSIINI
jgi:hypothetical protein